jgi:AcrR family transcriptional regulator
MTPETDGRLRRSAATRERIVSAMADLIREGIVAPTTDMIASRAGVSSRSLFFRFRDTPELFLAVIDQVMLDLVPRLPPVPTGGALPLRAHHYIQRRAKSGEEFRHFWRTGMVLFPSHPGIAARGQMLRDIVRSRTETTFAPELGQLSAGSARSLVDAIVAAGHWETWDMMRRNLGLSIDEARRAVEVMVHGAFMLHGYDAEDTMITDDAAIRLTERGRA